MIGTSALMCARSISLPLPLPLPLYLSPSLSGERPSCARDQHVHPCVNELLGTTRRNAGQTHITHLHLIHTTHLQHTSHTYARHILTYTTHLRQPNLPMRVLGIDSIDSAPHHRAHTSETPLRLGRRFPHNLKLKLLPEHEEIPNLRHCRELG